MAKNSRTNNCSFEDRFIPRRTGQGFQYFDINSCLQSYSEIKPDTRRYINYGTQVIQKDQFQRSLLEVMGPKSRKVFSFSKSPPQATTANFKESWPVKPRKKACIKSPEYLLDMPDLEMNLCHSVIDWSYDGRIAAIFKGRAHTWQPENASTVVQAAIEGKVKRCLKFNTTGTLLAMALAKKGLIIANLITGKMEVYDFCFGDNAPEVTAVEWLNNDTLIIGSSKGLLLSIKKQHSSHAMVKGHTGAITSIKKSCKEHYLATAGLDTALIIWTLPRFEVLFEAKLFSPIKAFAWHPWKEPLIATPGGSCNNILILWNVAKAKEEYVYHEFENLTIDALTFNNISAELVISCFNKTTLKSYILILAAFTKVVEVIEWHTGRIPYLVWSGDHKQLLTAGADENLAIWQFFGKQKKKILQRSEKHVRTLLSSFCIR